MLDLVLTHLLEDLRYGRSFRICGQWRREIEQVADGGSSFPDGDQVVEDVFFLRQRRENRYWPAPLGNDEALAGGYPAQVAAEVLTQLAHAHRLHLRQECSTYVLHNWASLP